MSGHIRTTRNDVHSANASPIYFGARPPTTQPPVPTNEPPGLLADYTFNSTVHGIRYMFDRQRHWTERLWWCLSFTISLCTCCYLIYQVYRKWNDTPVIVSFSEKSTHIWEIPFPAVTICPETKTRREVFNYSDTLMQLKQAEFQPPFDVPEENLTRFQALSEVCNYKPGISLFELTDHENYTVDIVRNLRLMAPGIDECMHECRFRSNKTYCDNLFEQVITEVGQCFTFNSLNSSEFYRSGTNNDYFVENNGRSVRHWHPDTGYDNDRTHAEPYPFRALGPGAQNGLTIKLHQLIEDLDYTCRFPVQGFRFMLHVPGEFPQMSQYYSRIPLDEELLVVVKPNMITTSEGLRRYPPTRRQCFYNSDRQLRFFRVYTQRNCQLECLANATSSRCGCVRLGYPRDADTPICGQSKFECYNDVKNVLMRNESRNSEPGACECLPACTSITYDAEISQATANWKETYAKFEVDNYNEIISQSQITIYFKDILFTTSRRSELYGYSDFVSNCGGLLGLFMGVSLLSIVEILYFGTLRVFCNLRSRPGPHQVHQSDDAAGDDDREASFNGIIPSNNEY